jgi:hypothetical protein
VPGVGLRPHDQARADALALDAVSPLEVRVAMSGAVDALVDDHAAELGGVEVQHVPNVRAPSRRHIGQITYSAKRPLRIS